MKIQSKLLDNNNFKKGLVSYALCIHEKHPYLNKCISSIFEQTYKKIELIIVIDNNDQNLKSFIKGIIKKKKIKYIFNKNNLGLAKSLNKAILGLDDGALDTRSITSIAWKPDVTRLSEGYTFRNPLSYEVKWVM